MNSLLKLHCQNPHVQFAMSLQKHSSLKTNIEEEYKKEKGTLPHSLPHPLHHPPKEVDFSP